MLKFVVDNLDRMMQRFEDMLLHREDWLLLMMSSLYCLMNRGNHLVELEMDYSCSYNKFRRHYKHYNMIHKHLHMVGESENTYKSNSSMMSFTRNLHNHMVAVRRNTLYTGL